MIVIKTKKTILLLTGLLIGCWTMAQIRQITVTGQVKDENNQPMYGVNVIIKNEVGIGTITDEAGIFKIKAGENDVLVLSFIGYEKLEVKINGRSQLKVSMVPSSEAIEEVAVVAHGTQRKTSIVGAVTSIETKTLNVASSQPSNALAGNVAGIIAVQRSGEPGKNNSEFWIRGISTFGANASALVLVDGIERDFDEVNVEDIQDFTVLKDASATAVYGNRGANGVVLITTKRGKTGKLNIHAKVEGGLSARSKMPDYVDGATYATLANEAALSRRRDLIYSPAQQEIIRYGLDQDLFPDINWRDKMLNPLSWNYKTTLNLSGGSNLARYYISGADRKSTRLNSSH
jgi:TonB-linked SusC/RagA family outer membrane protein